MATAQAVTETPKFLTPHFEDRDFSYWSNRFKVRQEQYQETAEVIRNHVQIELPETSFIVFWGDHHIGSKETNYDRIEQELYAISSTPNTYVMILGDTIDGFFFNPAEFEQMEQPPEQYAYIKSMITYLGDHKKLLVGFGGDHDASWSKKMGTNPLADYIRATNSYYMEGVGYISLHLGENEYKITAGHQFPGSSIYNNNHPQRRAMNDSARGSDIVVSGHNHRKAVQQQPVQEFGNESRIVHYHALGAYKAGDDYSRKKGWADQTPDLMFGTGVLLQKEQKKIIDFYDILEGIKEIGAKNQQEQSNQ